MSFIEEIFGGDTDKALIFWGTLIFVSVWIIFSHNLCKQMMSRPAAFHYRGKTTYIDRKAEPFKFWLYAAPRLLAIALFGYFAALVLYFKLPEIFG